MTTIKDTTGAPPSYTPKQLNDILTRQVRLIALFGVIQAMVMMAAAGTLDYPLGWRYLFFYLGSSVTMTRMLAKRDPVLLAERSRVGPGSQGWDRVLLRGIEVAGPLLIVTVAGLDRRFSWSRAMTDGLTLTALFAALAILYLLYRVIRINPFFSNTIRIQTERGHYVVGSGAYTIVRHPGYALMILYYLTLPFIVGSWWALVPALMTVALIVTRTVLEDRILLAELPGYRDFAGGVRYRLIPGIW